MEKDTGESDQDIDFVHTAPLEDPMFKKVDNEAYTSTEYLRLFLLFALWIGFMSLIFFAFFRG